MSWADHPRRCVDCAAVTYRPPRDPRACRWCGGELRDETAAEGAARRQRALDAANGRGQA